MYTKEDHKIIATFKSFGISITKSRLAVFKLFGQKKEALATSYINEYFSKTLDRISIYRSLKLFLKKGILLRIPNIDGEIRYLLVQNNATNNGTNKNRVTYFVCTNCDQMKMLDAPIFQKIKIPNSVNAKQCYFVIEGICDGCEG